MSSANVVVKVQVGEGVFDIALDPDNVNESFYLEFFKRNCFYEPETVALMHRVVRPGDKCIDAGAHIGFFTLVLSRLVGSNGDVLAFEPGRNNLPKLKHNLAINNVSNVRLIEQPAWDRPERIKFYLNSDSSGGNAVWDPGNYPWNEKSRARPECYEVDAVRIDQFSAASTKLAKIDVEGAEHRAILGMGIRLPKFIIMEIGPFGFEQLGTSTNHIRTYLKERGYDVFILHPFGGLPALVPDKTELTHEINEGQHVVMNVLFSTLDAVAEYWPRAPIS